MCAAVLHGVICIMDSRESVNSFQYKDYISRKMDSDYNDKTLFVTHTIYLSGVICPHARDLIQRGMEFISLFRKVFNVVWILKFPSGFNYPD